MKKRERVEICDDCQKFYRFRGDDPGCPYCQGQRFWEWLEYHAARWRPLRWTVNGLAWAIKKWKGV